MKNELKYQVLGIVLLAGVGHVLSAQGSRPAGDGFTQDTLVSEVRALRADIHQLANAGIQTQLLVARLELEERRVYAVGQQLTDTQKALNAVRARIKAERARIGQLEEAASRARPEALRSLQQSIAEAASQIELQAGPEQQLQAKETELLGAISEAEGLWTDFNTRLSALEKTLGARAQQ